MATATPTVQDLPVDKLDPSPDNPRTAFGGDLGDLAELTELIKAQGVLQRLVVCPEADGRYQLVFGHRRLEAAKAAGLAEVPVEVRDYDEAQRFTAMYGENFGREGLSPLQEAFAYKQALERKRPGGKKLFTTRTLAERVGVSQAKISKYTSIFKLPEHVVAMLTARELSVTEAVHLARLANSPDRVEAALAEYRHQPHKDMELAVRAQQADLDREAKVAATTKELEAAGARMAPADWRDASGKRLGDGYYDLHVTPEEHAGEPCHAAIVTHHGEVAWVCTHPDRHRPGGEPPAAPEPPAATATPAGAQDVRGQAGQTGQPGSAAVAADAAGSPSDADTRAGSGPSTLAVAPEPSAEELAAKARMDQAREAARREQQERERAARELAEQLEQAYEARTGALRSLLGGRLSRPEATRLLARFLLRLAFQDVYYDDHYLRHVLDLGDGTGGESPVLAFAGKNDDALLRAALALVAENAEEALAAGDQPDFTNPVVVLYYDFLVKAAAYKPSEFERATLAHDADDGGAAPAPAKEHGAEEAAGS
jgi:ParB family chromosome partitioning protein